MTRAGLRVLQEVDKPMLDLGVGRLGHLGERRLKTLSTLLEDAREHAG
jgi:hypothetical protein